jgi:hypothetical protein|tara:strand:+ start:1309 stop:2028 length:720 start_codon:yes stop_codon:yes gene_type:complete
MEMALHPSLRLYEKYWDKRPKHKGTIPKELLSENINEIEVAIPRYEGRKAEFLADVMGGATLFTDTSKIRGVIAETTDSLPLQLQDRGLRYTVALTPSYGLIHNVPEAKWRGAMGIETSSRREIPGEELDGNIGALLAPAYITPTYSVHRTICPFLFTDFEVEDRRMRRNFRRITSARQIGRLLGGLQGEQQLELLVGEFLGVHDDYREWVEEVGHKTPFKDTKELQDRYEGIDLKKYF